MACKLLADRSCLRLVLPRPWAERYGPYFSALDDLLRVDADHAYSLPLVADRVVLSHAGWRAWALRHPTSQELAARLTTLLPSGGTAAPSPTEGAAATAVAGCTADGRPGAGQEGCAAAAAACCRSAAVPVQAQRAFPVAQLSGRQLRTHFPQVSGKDLTADPAELAARLRGRGLWGWFQFPASYFAPYRQTLRQLLALRPGLRDTLQAALDAVLSARPPARAPADSVSDRGGGAATTAASASRSRPNDSVNEGGGAGEARSARRRLVVMHLRRGDFRELPLRPAPPPGERTAPLAVPDGGHRRPASLGSVTCSGGAAADALRGAGRCARAGPPHGGSHDSGGGSLRGTAQSSSARGDGREAEPGYGRAPAEGAARAPEPAAMPPPLVGARRHLHHRDQLLRGHDLSADGGSGNGRGMESAAKPLGTGVSARRRRVGDGHEAPRPVVAAAAPPPASSSPAAAAAGRRLRDRPPFEDDGVQGGAWCDRSGVDFRTPLEMYGTALAALPYDPDVDLLWVCSDDPQLASRAEVCGLYGTSWAAEAAAAASAAAAAGPDARRRVLNPNTAKASSVGPANLGDSESGQSSSGCSGFGDACGGTAVTAAATTARQEGGQQRTDTDCGPSEAGLDRLRRLDLGAPDTAPQAPRTPRCLHFNDGGSGNGSANGSQGETAQDAADGWGATAAALAPATATAALSPCQLQLLSEHPLLADWFMMQRADVLLASNSTLSFTAAMLNAAAAEEEESNSGGGGGTAPVMLRPDPAAGAFRRFDPWVELPLLPSAPVAGNHSLVAMMQQEQQQRQS